MTLTTDQALAALRTADPATGGSASGVTADAVVARATQPRPEVAASNLELHVAARRAPGRGHRLRTGLAVAATVVTLAGLAIGVTHGNRETHGPAPSRYGSISQGSIGAGRPAWSILTGVTAVTVAVSGHTTNAGVSNNLIVGALNSLPVYDGRYENVPCPQPRLTPLTVTFRSGERVVAVARPSSCGTIALTVPGHAAIVLMGADLSKVAFGLFGN